MKFILEVNKLVPDELTGAAGCLIACPAMLERKNGFDTVTTNVTACAAKAEALAARGEAMQASHQADYRDHLSAKQRMLIEDAAEMVIACANQDLAQ